ncbi:MAG: pentapeptide repeat-containing protein, partial [SAR324 cluster bacterium]|nr:pentapeptide repeat-containing protein [SAR324 cluster bacterium]
MKHILFILSFLLLSSPLFGQSEETCYVAADSSKDFDRTLLSNISVSLISEFLKEVEHLPPAGIPMDACVYQIDAVKVKDTTFVTFKGKNLNSYGDSKLSGPDGFQESVLKALYRALEDKRKLICDAYGEFIVECGGVVKKIPAEKIETIREMKNKYDQLEKRIAVLDTRIERLNSGAVKVVTNPDSFENPKLDRVKKVFTDEPVVQKIAKRKSDCLKNGMIRQLLDTKKCPNCDLCGADLNGEDLRGANLRGANLTKANLSDANLGHARLNGANLTGVIGKSAYMVDANLIEANLTDADLTDANLDG